MAERYGLLTDGERRDAYERVEAEDRLLRFVETRVVRPECVNGVLSSADSAGITEPTSIAELVRRPGVRLQDVLSAAEYLGESPGAPEWVESVEIAVKYSGYVARERASAKRLKELDGFILPGALDYSALTSLSFEAREKLQAIRPATLGQAGRVPGVSPSDLQNLVMEVLKFSGMGVSRETSVV